MIKKAIIYVRLVKESDEKTTKEIETEIFEELSKHPITIPWLAEVEKVKVVKE